MDAAASDPQQNNNNTTTSDDTEPIEESTGQDQVDYFDGSEGLTAIETQYAAQPASLPRRIHILGTGSIGKLVAHSLRGLANPPPITLIFHRYSLLKAWEDGKQEITIQDDGYDVPRSGFDVEFSPPVRREHGLVMEEGESVYDLSEQKGVRPSEAAKMIEEERQHRAAAGEDQQQAEPTEDTRKPRPGDYAISHDPIHNLIVTTKAPFTANALSLLKHRLTAKSTICFLQNGMGIIDELNRDLFPDAPSRPNYMQGIVTHGANVPPQKAALDPFYAVHAGHGTIALGLLPRDEAAQKEEKKTTPDGEESNVQIDKWSPSSRYLLRTLTRSPVLCAIGYAPTELLQQQLEKLAVNSIMNPLTSLLDNRNGSLLYNFALTRTMRLLLAETSHIIRHLPELRSVPNLQTRFSASRLETLVVSVAEKTKDNISSMLADVRAGRRTEIEYINGYIVARGEELGVKCLVNYAVMQTVVGKAMMTQREVAGELPEVGRGGVRDAGE